MYKNSQSSCPSWLDKLAACCSPPSPGFPPNHGYDHNQNKLSHNEKNANVWSDAPRLTPPPSFAPNPRPVNLTGNASTRQFLSDNTPGSNSNNSSNNSSPRSARSKRLVSRSRHGHSKSGSSTLIDTNTPNTGRRRSHSFRRRLRTSSSHSLFPLPSALSASSSTRRRPQISAPTNFRHMQSGTFVFPELPHNQQKQIQQYRQQQQQQELQRQQEREFQEQQQQFQQQYLQHYAQQYRQQYQEQFQRRPPSFQPLDFTHLPSPLTHSFQRATTSEGQIQIPARVHKRDGSHGSQDSQGSHGSSYNTQPPMDRSYSAMSFHLPRRPVGGSASSIRAVSRGNPSTSASVSQAPVIPLRSRLRSHSSPAVDGMVERIASAMLEIEKLQAEIDNVIERQSIYISSRPSTAHGMLPGGEHVNLPTVEDFDIPEVPEVPAVPAIPAAAPSFAERLSTDRPRTAPPRSSSLFPNGAINISSPSSSFGTSVSNTTTTTNTAPIVDAVSTTPSMPQMNTFDSPSCASVASAASKATKAMAKAAAANIAAANSTNANANADANSSVSSLQGSMRGGGSVSGHSRGFIGGVSRINGRPVDVPLAPPLPLVLRPPLRKKKSFSRVSTWLSFHHSQNGNGDGRNAYAAHDRELSFDSVTNVPRPITENDGFYQCLPARTSMDSLASTVDTLSTWTTERDMVERRRTDGLDEKGDEAITPMAETSTPTSTTTMATTMTYALANGTAMTTPTIPSMAGIPGFIPVVAASTMAEKSAGLIASAHRPQSVGVAF